MWEARSESGFDGGGPEKAIVAETDVGVSSHESVLPSGLAVPLSTSCGCVSC